MNELILVLEENPEVQSVISASLKDSPIFINQELNPDYFLQQIQNLNPDLIFISNSDSEHNYSTCRKIREDSEIKNIPLILLVNAKDEIDEDLLTELNISGILRKPFEASMLKEQINQFISLDENFGAEPDNENDNFAFDMSGIDSDLKEIKGHNQEQSQMDSKGTDKITEPVQNYNNLPYAISAGKNMDSIVLEDILIDKGNNVNVNHNEVFPNKKTKLSTDVPEQNMEPDYNQEIKSEIKLESHLTDSDLVTGGLEELKLSGLEDQYAESQLFDENIEKEQIMRSGLTDISLENNDFEDPSVVWSHPPDLNQIPREGLTEISLTQTDFHPRFPNHLASLEESPRTISQEDSSLVDKISEMDTSMLQTGNEVSLSVNGDISDKMLLNDSAKDYSIKNKEKIIIDSSLDEFGNKIADTQDADEEINSMVKESIEDQGIRSSETGLEELEDLSLQMESLEAEENELRTEETQFEKDVEKARIIDEVKTEDYPEDELTEFMVDELGDLLELDEDEDSDEDEQDYPYSEIKFALDEDVYASWDDAEEDFIGFEKDTVFSEDIYETEAEIGNEERFSFNEDELKNIVKSSVQSALEKSIASSLVELAVSEIKNNVSRRV